MVEYAEDPYTLYFAALSTKNYRHFLEAIADTPVHGVSDELYGWVRNIRNDASQPEDIRKFATEILGE